MAFFGAILGGFFFFILGIIIGSFLNVVTLRYNTGKSLSGRSGCLSCGAKLPARELIPLVSYCILRGRCAHCGCTISAQYPVVECLTGVLFATAFVTSFTGSIDVVYLVSLVTVLAFISILIVIAVYDLRHTIIPERPVWLLALLACALLFVDVSTFSFTRPHITALIAGPLVAVPLALLWLVSKGRLMGLGDAKLALGVGWFLGFSGAISALVISFWIGAGISLALLSVQKFVHRSSLVRDGKELTMKSEVPFAPFLAGAALLVTLFNSDIVLFLYA